VVPASCQAKARDIGVPEERLCIGHEPQEREYAKRAGEIVWLTGTRGHQEAQAQLMRHLTADGHVTRVAVSPQWLGAALQFGGLRNPAGDANESAPGGARSHQNLRVGAVEADTGFCRAHRGRQVSETTHSTNHLANTTRRHYNRVNAACIYQQLPRLTVEASLPLQASAPNTVRPDLTLKEEVLAVLPFATKLSVRTQGEQNEHRKLP